MIFYHGTKVGPEIVLKDGLKPCTIDFKKYQGINEEIDDHIRRKKEFLFVYLTSFYKEAHHWAKCGSNFINNLKLELGEETLHKEKGYIYSINLKIVRKGEFGVRYVPIEYIVGYALADLAAQTGVVNCLVYDIKFFIILTGDMMGDDFLESIKEKINNFLWMVLPEETTLKQAEELALDFEEKLRKQYCAIKGIEDPGD